MKRSMLVGVLISAILVTAVAVSSQTKCAYAAQPVRIVETVPIYFDTLQAAFNEATDGDTVEAQNIVFPESLIVTKSLTLIGGYEKNFSSNPGFTSVRYLTITGGSLVVENLVIGGRANPPLTITVPDAPTNVMAVPGNTQVGVTFTAPASDGGSAISGYTVISNPAGGHDSNDGSTALSHIVSGLTNGTVYTFTVKATNAAGTGPASTASNSVTPTITNPNAQFKDTAIVSGQGRFNNLVLSGTTLFWGDGDSGKGIWKYTNGDSSPQLLVPRLSQISNIVVHGNYAYWINTDFGGRKFSIYRTTLDASQTTLLTQGDAPFPTAYLAADDTVLYFTAKDTSSQATNTASVVIQRFPLDGSAPTTLYHVAKGAAGLATDDNYIYVLDETGADPSAANLVRISKTDGSSQTLAQNIAKVNGAMTIANGAIFVGTYGKLLKFTTSGGTPTVLTSGNTVGPYFLTVAQDTIYWINYNRDDYDNPYNIQAMPVGGGDVTVVATNLNQPSNLLAAADGLYWSESQNNGEILKTLPWQRGQVTAVAGGLYISSLDVLGGNAYLTQNMPVTGFSELSKVSLADGLVHPLYGGVNTTTYTFCATADSLVIGDKSALKKVPISGGITSTLAIDIGFDIKDVKDLSGTAFFTSYGDKSGVFKISDAGGSYVRLAQESGIYGTIVSVQDGYVYYVLSQPNYSGGTTSELRRVRADGSALSESYFKVPTQYALVQFDGIETVYLTQWLYNDQYEYLKYDVATGNVVKLFSGRWLFNGVNSFYVFFADFFGNVYRVSNNGGQLTPVISVPYPLELKTHWVPYGNGFYFIISYLDPKKGYLSEIDYLEQVK